MASLKGHFLNLTAVLTRLPVECRKFFQFSDPVRACFNVSGLYHLSILGMKGVLFLNNISQINILFGTDKETSL